MTIMPAIATMITTMTTGTDAAALYRLMTWLSPAYPIGSFSYSHGLEMAVEEGAVRDRTTLVAYIESVLSCGAGHVDAALLAAAWRAGGDPARLDEIADLADAWRGTAETALESGAQGAAFLRATNAAWPAPGLAAFTERRSAAASFSVAVGIAAAEQGVPLAAALTAFLQAFAANLVSAGVRLVPLGQTDGQATLAALEPVVAAAVETALAADLDAIGSAAPAIDLLSMRHETQYTRLFRS
jgi:urease accessory protein